MYMLVVILQKRKKFWYTFDKYLSQDIRMYLRTFLRVLLAYEYDILGTSSHDHLDF